MDPPSAESQERSARRFVAASAATLLLAPVFYVLSIGPVARLYPSPGSGLRTFYTPVIWLHDNTPLRDPLERWVRLWGGR